MSKSIIRIALDISRKREEAIEEEVIKTIQAQINEQIEWLQPWTAIGTDSRYVLSTAKKININKQIEILRKIGFIVTLANGLPEVSVPEWSKGEKKTLAQMMVYRCNIEVEKRVRAERAKARAVCKEAFTKIKSGDFKSDKDYCNNKYHITISVNFHNSSNTVFRFRNEMKKIMEQKGFTNVSFGKDTIELSIDDT